jgi:hypothetical protein
MTMYGPEAALIAEAFTPRLRYSGARSATSWPRSSPADRRVHFDLAVRDVQSHVPIGIYVRSARSSASGDADAAGLHKQGHLEDATEYAGA